MSKQESGARKGRWQDSYHVGQRVEVLVPMADGRRWVPAIVTRKTASGQPEVRTQTLNPITYGNGQLRKSDLRPRARYLASARGLGSARPEGSS